MNKKADVLNVVIILFITLTIIAYFITFYHFFLEKPKIIEHNITVEKEVIKEIEIPCPELSCPECEECPENNYTRPYILRLIREAKRCEQDNYLFNVTECQDELYKVNKILDACSNGYCRYNSTWC